MSMKTAWVTGASSGIGLAICQRLLASGWQVLGIDRSEAALSDAHYSHVQVDLADAQAIHACMQEHANAPWALVHAAGLMHTAALGQLNVQAGEQMWQVHVQAATVLANALLPRIQQKREGGRLVLIGSRVSGGMPGRSQYAASKAALVSMARSWAAEVMADQITVNVVSPAATDTPMLQGASRASSAPKLPLIGRLIRPQEVADLTAFLLSEQAAAITGQDIAVCGGASLPK